MTAWQIYHEVATDISPIATILALAALTISILRDK